MHQKKSKLRVLLDSRRKIELILSHYVDQIFVNTISTQDSLEEDVKNLNIWIIKRHPFLSNPGLVNQQIEVCQKFPQKIFSISVGARTGILECHYQFRFERWNCTTNAGYESVFGHMLDKGKGVFLVKTINAFLPAKHDNSVNTYLLISLSHEVLSRK